MKNTTKLFLLLTAIVSFAFVNPKLSEPKQITLQERTQIINTIKPDLVLSLHVNSNKNKEKSGVEFFVANKEVAIYEKSNDLAVKLSSEFAKNNSLTIGEIKNAPFYILKFSGKSRID